MESMQTITFDEKSWATFIKKIIDKGLAIRCGVDEHDTGTAAYAMDEGITDQRKFNSINVATWMQRLRATISFMVDVSLKTRKDDDPRYLILMRDLSGAGSTDRYSTKTGPTFLKVSVRGNLSASVNFGLPRNEDDKNHCIDRAIKWLIETINAMA